jgi:dTDP-4-dehydrorhamnose reductase
MQKYNNIFLDKKIIVIGYSGFFGSYLCNFFSNKNIEFIKVGRRPNADCVVEINNILEITKLLNYLKPDYIINLAAATNVDECQSNVKISFKTNTLIPFVISSAIKNSKNDLTHFLHLSTDQVYSGEGNHIEDEVAPVNIYGLSKLEGEMSISNKNSCILRTNFFGKSLIDKESYTDWIVNSLKFQKKITIYDDVKFNALHVSTLCDLIVKFLIINLKGTFNIGCTNSISKSDFALKLASEIGLSHHSASRGFIVDNKNLANRPKDMSMNIRKIETKLNIKMPFIDEEINKCAKDYLL